MTPKAPIKNLHEAMALIADGLTSDIGRGVRYAERALQDGGNVESSQEGMTPLARLFLSHTKEEGDALHSGLTQSQLRGLTDARHNARLKMGALLLKAGANPWSGEINCWDIPRQWGGIYLMQMLKEYPSLRGPEGDTPLHALLRRHDSQLDLYGLDSLIDRDWIQQRNARGQLPLHALMDGIINGKGMEPDNLGTMLAKLMRYEMTLDSEDNDGLAVADMILRHPASRLILATEDDLLETHWIDKLEQASAESQKRSMERQTLPAAKRGSGSFRL